MGEALRRRRRAVRVMHRLVASDIALKDFRRPVRTSTWSIASKSARAARAPRVADGALASRVMALEPVMATLSELLQATAVVRLRAVSAAAREAVRASARLRLRAVQGSDLPALDKQTGASTSGLSDAFCMIFLEGCWA